MCSRSRSIRVLPPPPGSAWRAHLAWSWCWATVGPFHAVRAPLRVLPRSRAPFGLFFFFRRGSGPVPFPPSLGWGCVPPLGRACAARTGADAGGGGLCALPRSVPLPSLRRQQSGCHQHRSGHGGRGPHTALVRVRVSPPCVVRVAALCAGSGSACLLRSPLEQAVGAWRRVAFVPCCVLSSGSAVLPGEGRTPPLPWGEWGPAPLWPAGRRGGVGGEGGAGRAVVPLLPALGGRPVARGPNPPSASAHPPPCMLGRPGWCGSPGRRAQPAVSGSAWRGGGGGAARVSPFPEVWPQGLAGRGVALPRSVPLPSLGRQQSGCLLRCSGYGRLGPHIAPVRVPMMSPDVIRAASSCDGASSLACGTGRGGAWRAGSAVSNPLGVPAHLGGGRTSPLPRGGGGRASRRGEWGERGGAVAPWFPTILLGDGGLWSPAQPAFVAGAFLSPTRVKPGPLGSLRPRAPPGWPPPLHTAFPDAAVPPRSTGRP